MSEESEKLKREEERKRRREERERKAKEEEELWAQQRKKREEDRRKKREQQLVDETASIEKKERVIEQEAELEKKKEERRERKLSIRLESSKAQEDLRKINDSKQDEEETRKREEEKLKALKAMQEEEERLRKEEEEEEKELKRLEEAKKKLEAEETERLKRIQEEEERLRIEEEEEEEELRRKEKELLKKKKALEEAAKANKTEEVSEEEERIRLEEERLRRIREEEERLRREEEEEEEELRRKEEELLRKKRELQAKLEEEERLRKLREEEEAEEEEIRRLEELKKQRDEEIRRKLAEEEEEKLRKLREEEEAEEEEIRRLEELKKQREAEREKRRQEEERLKQAEEKDKEAKKLQEEKEMEERRARIAQLTQQTSVQVLTDEQIKQLETNLSQQSQNEKIQREKKLFSYSLFQPQISKYFDSLKKTIRELGKELSSPEIVVIGPKSSGKSSFLEAFIGNAVGFPEFELTQPIYTKLIPNTAAKDFIYKLKKPTGNNFTSYPRDKLVNEIKNALSNKSPVHLNIESKDFGFELVIIDTPAIGVTDQLDNVILKLLGVGNRLIVCVDEVNADFRFESQPTPRMIMNRLIQKVDPSFRRTLFVHTKVDGLLQTCKVNKVSLNRYFRNEFGRKSCYWIATLSSELRQNAKNAEDFRKSLLEQQKKILDELPNFDFDKSFAKFIGVGAVIEHIVNFTWNSYKTYLPLINGTYNQEKKRLEIELYTIEEKQKMLTTAELRTVANKYVVQFLQTLTILLQGEEKLDFPGQTLSEEREDQGHFIWLSSTGHGKSLKLDNPKFIESVPLANERLTGVHQFKRLISELGLLMDQIKFSEVSSEELELAVGIKKVENRPDYVYGACEIAQQRSHDILLPLVDEVAGRCVYLLRKQAEIAERIVRRDPTLDNHLLFFSYIRELFFKFVENLNTSFINQCKQEFYSTKTIYWNFIRENPNQKYEKGSSLNLSKQIFTAIKDRIHKQLVLMICNWFLFSILDKTNGFEEIESSISVSTDQQLEELFQIQTQKETLQKQYDAVKKLLDQQQEKEKSESFLLTSFPSAAN